MAQTLLTHNQVGGVRPQLESWPMLKYIDFQPVEELSSGQITVNPECDLYPTLPGFDAPVRDDDVIGEQSNAIRGYRVGNLEIEVFDGGDGTSINQFNWVEIYPLDGMNEPVEVFSIKSPRDYDKFVHNAISAVIASRAKRGVK